jgi:hypothetical protein
MIVNKERDAKREDEQTNWVSEFEAKFTGYDDDFRSFACRPSAASEIMKVKFKERRAEGQKSRESSESAQVKGKRD